MANIIRRYRGLFISKYPEGVEAVFNVEPAVINIDSNSSIILYQFLSILNEFSTYAGEKMAAVLSQSSSDVDENYAASSSGGNGVVSVATDSHALSESKSTSMLDTVSMEEPPNYWLNFMRTFHFEIGAKFDLCRIRFCETSAAASSSSSQQQQQQQRCCMSLDLEHAEVLIIISPEQSLSVLVEDFWWNAFNRPDAVFYDSFIAKLVDEPFDQEKLKNPFARRKRKVKSVFSRGWEKQKEAAKRRKKAFVNYFHKLKYGETEGEEAEEDEEDKEDFDGRIGHTDGEGRSSSKRDSKKTVTTSQSEEFKNQLLSVSEMEETLKARNQWIVVKGSLTLSSEYLNRSDKSNYSFIEPFKIDLCGTKLRPDYPTNVALCGSWINLNVDVALIDAVLVFALSVVSAAIRKREVLYMDEISVFFKRTLLTGQEPAETSEEAVRAGDIVPIAQPLESSDNGSLNRIDQMVVVTVVEQPYCFI